jgi:hypothetical protein
MNSMNSRHLRSVLTNCSRRQWALGVAATLVIPTIAAAQAQTRGGLYDPEPPLDSDYVRVVVGADPATDIFLSIRSFLRSFAAHFGALPNASFSARSRQV